MWTRQGTEKMVHPTFGMLLSHSLPVQRRKVKAWTALLKKRSTRPINQNGESFPEIDDFYKESGSLFLLRRLRMGLVIPSLLPMPNPNTRRSEYSTKGAKKKGFRTWLRSLAWSPSRKCRNWSFSFRLFSCIKSNVVFFLWVWIRFQNLKSN